MFNTKITTKMNDFFNGENKYKTKVLNISNQIINPIKSFYLKQKTSIIQKRIVKKQYAGKLLDSVENLLDTINSIYLKNDIYLDPSKNFLTKINYYEILNIRFEVSKYFKFESDLENIRFYLIKSNSENLFNGYRNRLHFYNIKTKYKLKMAETNFYKQIYEIVKNETKI